MADTTYRVVLDLSTQGNLGATLGQVGNHATLAHRSLERLGEMGKSVGEAFSTIGEKIGGALESAADKALELGKHLAMAGAVAGVAAATYGVAHLNQELENTQISLAAMAQAQGFSASFEGGMKIAADQIAHMKQDVKALPGDLGQLSDMMKMIATPAAQGGANFDQIRMLAGRTMLTSTILGVQQEVASREMAGLLSGRAGSHNILGARLGLIGEEAEKFNKMAPEQRLARINAELDKYGGAADRFAQSYVANFTTLVDNVKYSIIANTTAPLFEHVKRTLAEINNWFDMNQDKVQFFAETVGNKLANAWDAVVNAAKRLEPIVARIVGMMEDQRPGGGSLLHMFEKGAGFAIGGKLLGQGIGLAGKAGGSLISNLMGGGGEAMAGGLLSSFTVLAPALAVAATAAVSLAGAFHAFTDESSVFHDYVVETWNDITTRLGPALQRLGDDLAPLGDLVVYLADRMGADLMYSLDTAVHGLERFLDVLDKIAGYYHKLFGGGPTLGEDTPGAIKDHTQELMDNMNSSRFAGMAHAIAEADAKVKRGAGGGGGGTKIEAVYIEVKGNPDPSRVARLTKLELDKLARNPTRSRFAVDYSGNR